MQTTSPDTPRKKELPPNEIQKRNAMRERMHADGITVARWARENGFKEYLVQGVLRGAFAGDRGEAHRICIALGLKKGRVVPSAKGYRPEVQEAA